MSVELEVTQQTIGITIGLCTLGVFVWRVSTYFWRKSKCFDSLKTSVRQTEKNLGEVRTQLTTELLASQNTHIELFKRLNAIDKKLAWIAGKNGYTE